MNKIIPMLVIVMMPFLAKGEGTEIKTCSLGGLDAKTEWLYDVSRSIETGYDEQCAYHSHNRDVSDCSHSYFKGLKSGEWAVSFKHGKLKGIAKCSSTDGIYAVVDDPDIRANREKSWEKQYCWCKPTVYTPKGDSECYVKPSSWFFLEDCEDNYMCNGFCAYLCARYVSWYIDFRSAIFGQD